MVKNIISMEDVITQKLGLDSTYMDDEIVMMDISKGKYYGFNSVGSRVWELIEKRILVRELISTLLNEFEVDEKTCEDSVLTFLNRIYDEELISVV